MSKKIGVKFIRKQTWASHARIHVMCNLTGLRAAAVEQAPAMPGALLATLGGLAACVRSGRHFLCDTDSYTHTHQLNHDVSATRGAKVGLT